MFGGDVHHKGRAEEEAFDLRQSGTGGQVTMTVCVITGVPPSQVLCYTPSDVILTCEVPRGRNGDTSSQHLTKLIAGSSFRHFRTVLFLSAF